MLPIISSQNNLIIPGSKNIFAKIQEINTIYHLLQEKSLEYKQYNEKFIAVIGCFSFIASQINNKAEILTEDIEDIVLANPLYDQFQDWYKDTLRNIYQVSLNNREEMTEIMKVMTLTIQEVSHNARESVDIIQILTSELNIEAELIIIDNNLKYETFSGMFFRKLLIQSLHSAILYAKDCGNIIQVLLTQNELIYSINFVCSRSDVDVHGQELDLMKCRAWALVNCASIDVHYTPNIMALSFQIHKILF